MTNNIEETSPFSSLLPVMKDEGNLKESYVHDDYSEEIWVKDPPKEKIKINSK